MQIDRREDFYWTVEQRGDQLCLPNCAFDLLDRADHQQRAERALPELDTEQGSLPPITIRRS